MNSFPLPSPVLIAHRYGNALDRLAPASEAGADLVELDVWFHRGRLEVGHDKTLGPIPLRWDRWSLALGRRRPLTVADLIAALPHHLEPMFDLKGKHPGLAPALSALIAACMPGRPFAVASQHWNHLEPFIAAPDARVIRSADSPAALGLLVGEIGIWHGAGAGFNRHRFTPDLVDNLRRRTGLVLSWTVNDLPTARSLIAAGVTGIITDNLEVVRTLRADRDATSEAPSD
jgi:hypothetical protein